MFLPYALAHTHRRLLLQAVTAVRSCYAAFLSSIRMQFKFSGNLNFPTSQWKEATEFYKRVFGLTEGNSSETYSHLKSDTFHIYFDSDTSTAGPIFEFYVPDLDAA